MSDQNQSVERDELEIFVSSTLKAIMAGIADAQSDARGTSAHGTIGYGFSPPDQVAFDVAVHATTTGKVGAGFKLSVFSVGANAGGSSEHQDASISRISFTVPTSKKRLS